MGKFLKSAGFTLIELIIVIAIIALLAAATFVAINPGKRIGDANDSKRWQDITAIADAYSAFLVDNNGTLPTTTANGTVYMIATTTGATYLTCTATTTSLGISLEALTTSSPAYLGQIPTDPSWSYSVYSVSTGYWLRRDSTGKLTVGACNKYGTNYPTVTR